MGDIRHRTPVPREWIAMTSDIRAGSTGPEPGGRPPPPPANEAYVAMEADPRFAELRRRYRSFVFPMTVAFLGWYLLYVILSAYARGLMDTKIVGHINVALVFGLLQFLSTFAIAWYYERYSRERLDPVSSELRGEIR
jgi:uncharacterized membrane protein (DUF485 family)